ncbi:LysM peptidoglycan-binding domain-containing protein [Streptococcus parasanguinis]|uniref:aggregation-promoting factor n=1 Tax=Streptococcus parasanguinis TaxID=1318 RepID=UPI001D06FBD3|nr:LysM peptidoglycan-binding domain-containing protein [Streptococcus parasanguinis]MCB6704521.1 LysM peptidoglycan-binding domain-containing protein [Streptococcus parasanguinis]MCB6739159.1 LysM peptidoglycan-binding domain-containing protein [Streptococcus parasanguinis]MCB7322150.1 LysM peptidoglycan-binding domain-containing protein [Streptococcus parasanguinis]MCB7402305.1 LysM peptidoglycan-binding domain-containing protein [Streptococcus parasanguinis]
MNKKQMMKRIIGLSLLAGLFLPIVANADSYTVKSGDTLSAIAKEKNTTVDAIAKKNKISNVNLISVGQVLEIEDANTTQKTTEQATTSQIDTTQATTTISASDGLSAEDAAAKEWIAQKESSGSYTAQNGQYYGRYQLTITYLNGDLSPANQEKVANQYVVNRYGSWSAAKNFWLANGWY